MNGKLSKIVAAVIFCLISIPAFVILDNNISFGSEVDPPENEYYDFEWLLPPDNYDGFPFSEGRAWFREKKDGPWTLIDEEGNVIKDGFEADKLSVYKESLAVFEVKDDDKEFHGFVNLSGDVVIPLAYYGGSPWYGEGLITKQAEVGYNQGYVNFDSEWAIPPIFKDAFAFSEGIARVRKIGDSDPSYIDKEGKDLFGKTFKRVEYFYHGTAIVSEDGERYGLIDKTGKYVVEPGTYDKFLRPESEPIGVVKDGKVGFIDSKGNVVIDFKFKPRLPRLRAVKACNY